ncbi:MAG: NAD(P)H-hydrate dehydratase [Actinomycetota bacterium]
MRPLLRPDEMARADRAAIVAGTPVEVLMERAGHAVARAAVGVAGGRNRRRALVVCGKGNNGGDGFVAARRLRQEGLSIVCLTTFDRSEVAGAAAHHLERLRHAGVVVRPFTPEVVDESFDVVVDAIFGTGFRGSPTGPAGLAVATLDGLPRVVAVDIPSGVDGLSGRVEGGAVHAEVTIALAAQKLGTALLPGASYAGRVEVADIGIDVALWKHGDGDAVAERPGPYVEVVEASDVRSSLTPRPLGAHKRSSGSVAILAGSEDTRGAALLTSLGALRMGAGYVTLGTTAAVQTAAAATAPELLSRTVTDSDVLGPSSLEAFAEVVERADALAVGPGLGVGEDQRALVDRIVREVDLPIVLDADALNVLAGNPGGLEARRAAVVITPHPAELARLLGISTDEVQADRIGAATVASKLFPAAAVVLKGFRTVVVYGEGAAALMIPVGGPELATAGTGDVLTGALATMLAGGLPRVAAATVAAYLHGVAGSIAAETGGIQGVLAGDVAAALPAARLRLADGPPT